MSKKPKWEPPPDLRAPPRDPKSAMLKDGAWFVFTVDGVACLFEKRRISWPNEHTLRKSFIGHDWVPHGPVETANPGDCLTIANIRAEVRDFQRGFT
jgi:hypothetical protein